MYPTCARDVVARGLVPTCARDVVARGLVPTCARDVVAPGLVPTCARDVVARGLVPTCARDVVAHSLVPTCARDVVAPGLVPTCARDVVARGLVVSTHPIVAAAQLVDNHESAATSLGASAPFSVLCYGNNALLLYCVDISSIYDHSAKSEFIQISALNTQIKCIIKSNQIYFYTAYLKKIKSGVFTHKK